MKSIEEKKLRPVRANLGIEVAYRRQLAALVDEMARSVERWLLAAYRADPPVLAADDEPDAREAFRQPVNAIKDAMRGLRKRWLKNFDEAATRLAKYFSISVARRSDASLKTILREGGFSIKFKMTRGMRDILNATVEQNVALIRSIPERYLGEVEGMVMRSVQTGRDVGQLTKALRRELGVTKRRAALIARDQNNKATAAMNRARLLEMGVAEAIWMHSHAGKEPRPSHVAMNGKRFDVAKGMYDKDEGRYVMPSELINCRCTSRPVVPGFA